MRVTAAVNSVLGGILFLVAAQPGVALAQSERLELRNGDRAAGGVEVVVSTAESRQPVGTTNVMGVLDFPAALLTGKVRAEVYAVECDEKTTVLVVPEGAGLNAEDASCRDEDAPEDSCRCRRLGLFYWPFDAIQLHGGGFPARTVAIGSGVGAGLLVGIVALGGDEGASNGSPASGGSATSSTSPTPTATTPPPAPTTPTAPSATGTYPTSFTIRQDRAKHACCIPMPPNMNLRIVVESATIDISGTSPFVPVMGPYQAPGLRLRGVFDVRAGTFNATGSGTVAGFSGVRVELQGQISDAASSPGPTAWVRRVACLRASRSSTSSGGDSSDAQARRDACRRGISAVRIRGRGSRASDTN